MNQDHISFYDVITVTNHDSSCFMFSHYWKVIYNYSAELKVVNMVNKEPFCEHSLIKKGKLVLIVSQITFIIPVYGILNEDFHAIKFSYFSAKTILFVVVQASVACMVVCYSIIFVRYNCRLIAAGDVLKLKIVFL